MYRIVKERVPAKTLSDVEISDSVWKADFDIVDRYQNFANELMRIDLLAIAGFGFLIKEVVIGKNIKLTERCFSCMIAASICIVLSLIAVLIHRFLSTSCLYYQVVIMRSLKRLENDHWSEKEITDERIFLANARNNQTKQSDLSNKVLIAAAILFVLSLILVTIVFYKAVLLFAS